VLVWEVTLKISCDDQAALDRKVNPRFVIFFQEPVWFGFRSLCGVFPDFQSIFFRAISFSYFKNRWHRQVTEWVNKEIARTQLAVSFEVTITCSATSGVKRQTQSDVVMTIPFNGTEGGRMREDEGG
jgi:hypothetical protein